MGILVKVKTVV